MAMSSVVTMATIRISICAAGTADAVPALCVDHGSRLLWAFLHQIWTLLKGVGLKLVGLAFQIAGLLDWLADLFFHQFDRVILRTLVP